MVSGSNFQILETANPDEMVHLVVFHLSVNGLLNSLCPRIKLFCIWETVNRYFSICNISAVSTLR